MHLCSEISCYEKDRYTIRGIYCIGVSHYKKIAICGKLSHYPWRRRRFAFSEFSLVVDAVSVAASVRLVRDLLLRLTIILTCSRGLEILAIVRVVGSSS